MQLAWCLLMMGFTALAGAQTVSPTVAAYLALRPEPGQAVYLDHVRVIDGTGAAVRENQTLVLRDGKIAEMRASGAAASPSVEDKTARHIDLSGHTVFPGIVGMHDHLFYIARPDADAERHAQPPLLVPQMTFSAPRLYLAAGVTTMRTTGSV